MHAAAAELRTRRRIPIALQATLADWAAQAVPFVCMEASSHALDQGRLHGVDVDTAIFTNLSRDHLDYHGDMASYGRAKARLFEFSSLRTVVLNADDPFARAAARGHCRRAWRRCATAGTPARMCAAKSSSRTPRAPSCAFESLGNSAHAAQPAAGRFNAMNLLRR
jgi:UDP-N-acetylmuramoyl-L-alanyl-D-glutamate--2,6-diaminopimelate ligase